MKKLLGILLFISIALSANAQLLWKVSGKGLEKPSYIFGTYHLSPLSIKDSIAAMPQAMSETAQVYGEVVMSEMATPAFMQSMQQQMMMPKDTTLQSLFTPEQYEEVGKAIKDIDIDDNAFKSIEAIIYSMTPEERSNPAILNGSRRQRIAKGSGTNIQEVNRLLKQFDQTRKMMKMVTGSKMGKMMPKLKR